MGAGAGAGSPPPGAAASAGFASPAGSAAAALTRPAARRVADDAHFAADAGEVDVREKRARGDESRASMAARVVGVPRNNHDVVGATRNRVRGG